MTLCISDQADEFRIEISGRFVEPAVADAATAWRAALLSNTPRRICVDITRMTDYDRAGLELLRGFYTHGTHIAAATPRSLSFLTEISKPANPSTKTLRNQEVNASKRPAKQVFSLVQRAVASGE